MSGANFLGLDLGTSSVKALLVDAGQTVLAETSVPLNISRPHPLWSEQDPRDWWRAVSAAVDAIRRLAPTAWVGLGGVGLSGQMHGATLLDASGEVLRPAILWNDGRASAECVELERRVPDLRRRAGNIAMPGFTAPKLLWLRRHEPDVFAAIRKILLPKDYLRLRLTGAYVSDMSDAAGTLWLDVAARAWDDALLAATDLGRAYMPDLVEGPEISAFLRPEIAAGWGLSGREIPVAGGGGDNAASAVGIGATRPGQGFLSLGTSGVLFAVTDRLAARPERGLHAFCHALPGRWHGMSVILSAAASLDWVARLTGTADNIPALLARVDAWASVTTNRAGAPIFLPYLSGERTPHNDAEASGVLAGLRAEHGVEAVAYAVMEGVAFALADGLEVLREAGAGLERCLLIGGGARGRYWGQLLSDVLGIDLALPRGAEVGAALGAARLAILASGAGSEDEVCRQPEIQAVLKPFHDHDHMISERRGRFRALYPTERAARR